MAKIWKKLTEEERNKAVEKGWSEESWDKEPSNMSEEDLLTMQAEDVAKKTTEAQAFNTSQEKKSTEVSNTAGDVYNAAQTANTLGQIGSGIAKMRRGREGLAKTEGERPAFTQEGQNIQLRDAISQAQYDAGKGMSDAAKGSLNKANITSYANALKQARTLGQAGATGSQNQNMFVNALRNNAKTALMDQTARAQNKQRLDSLIGVQEGARRAALQRLDYDRRDKIVDWRERMKGYQSLAATGEQNLQNQLSTLPYKLGNLTNDYFNFNQQRGRVGNSVTQAGQGAMNGFQGNIAPTNQAATGGFLSNLGSTMKNTFMPPVGSTATTLPYQAYGTPSNIMPVTPRNSYLGTTNNFDDDFKF